MYYSNMYWNHPSRNFLREKNDSLVRNEEDPHTQSTVTRTHVVYGQRKSREEGNQVDT